MEEKKTYRLTDPYDPYDIEYRRSPLQTETETEPKKVVETEYQRPPLGPLEDLEYYYPSPGHFLEPFEPFEPNTPPPHSFSPSLSSSLSPSEALAPLEPPKLEELPLTPSEPLKDIRIEDFNFPERSPSETTQPTKKVGWPRKIVVFLLFAFFFFNLGLNLSDTVESQIKLKKIAALIKTLNLDESNIKSQFLELRDFKNNLQHGPAFSYIDNRTKVLTIFCYPKKIIRQFTLENNFNFNDCNLTK